MGWTVYREPELFLRFSSIVSYAVAVVVLYVFLRRRLSHRGDALLGAAAFATTPIFLHYAFEARVYAMATMLVVLTVVAVERAAERPSRPRLALAALLGLLTVHAHIWTVCLFGALSPRGGVPSSGGRADSRPGPHRPWRLRSRLSSWPVSRSCTLRLRIRARRSSPRSSARSP